MAHTNFDKAHNDALAGMLRLWGPTANRDGVDLLREALDDTEFLRSVAKLMRSCLLDGGADHTELGRMVWEHVIAYAEGCAEFPDRVASELADQSEREAA